MSTLRDKARDFYDRISPRERRLVVVGAIVLPITLALWLGFAIHDGLDAMEQRNNDTRKALNILADMRARGTKVTTEDVALNAEPMSSFDTYLSNAAKKAKFSLTSTVQPHAAVTKNGFVTNSASVTVDKLNIQEVKDFLNAIETDSKAVAVTHLEVHRDFRDKEKLSATIEVTNYAKEAAAKGTGSGSDAGSASGSAAAAEKKAN